MIPLVTAYGIEIADEVLKWLIEVQDSGANIAVIEGLPGAGKSTILGQIRRRFTGLTIELDELLPKSDQTPDLPWGELVVRNGAYDKISTSVAKGFTLVEGAAAWPIVREWARSVGEDSAIARAYLKAVSRPGGTCGAIYWDAGRDLKERSSSIGPYLGSIYTYHDDERPWESADIIFERICL